MQNNILILVLFIIISILYAVEASTSLARLAGIKLNNLASGLQLQSGLSLFSRALMSVFMPILGILADSGSLNNDNTSTILFCTTLIPTAVYLVYLLRCTIVATYLSSALNLIKTGSYFPLRMSKKVNFRYKSYTRKKRNILILFRAVNFISYIPYYLSWPLIVLLLSKYPDNRGLIISMSSIINGLNTLALVMYVDPYLIRLSKYKLLSSWVYYDQLRIRVISAVIASFPFLVWLLLY